MILKRFSKANSSASAPRQGFHVEQLETRLMLSTVDIIASGQEGGETFSLIINGTPVQDYVVGTEAETFTFSDDELDFTADGIQIQFTNDYYYPQGDIDRNLVVDKIIVDGTVFETDSPTTFGTGTWIDFGIRPGFNQTEVLHANGFFEYADELLSNGYFWTRSNTTTGSDAYEREDATLALSGSEFADTSIWSVVPVEGNQLYEFAVEAWREVNAGEIQFDGQPWASVGVDLYDESGGFISKTEVQVYGPTTEFGDGSYRAREIFTPENAAYAGIWAWAQQTPSDVDIPLVIGNIDLYEIVADDVTPPTLTLLRSPVTEPTSGLQLTAQLVDPSDVVLVNNGGSELLIEGPNGYSVSISSIAGGRIENGLNLFYELPGSFDASDNGEYTVTAFGNKFRDPLGNFISEGTLVGTFTVSIQGDIAVG